MKLLISMIFCLVACGGNNNAFSQKPTLHAYGDSITFMHKPITSYVYRLAEELNMPLKNHAVSGSHIDSDNQYPELMVDKFNTGDIIVFLPGVNDAYIYGTSLSHFNLYKEEMKDILDRLSRLPIKVFIGTTMKTKHPKCPNALIELYGNVVRNIISEQKKNYKNIFLVDTFNEFKLTESNMLDYIHPNNMGNMEIKDIFLKVMYILK